MTDERDTAGIPEMMERQYPSDGNDAIIQASQGGPPFAQQYPSQKPSEWIRDREQELGREWMRKNVTIDGPYPGPFPREELRWQAYLEWLDRTTPTI